MNAELKEMINIVRSYTASEKESGMEEFFLPRVSHVMPQGATDSLESLKDEVSVCKGCGLWKTRRNVVFGSGNPAAGLMFVGEAPGYDEDVQGLPFVGRAGQLLTKIIEAMGLTREGVYIANILKCRPPDNRAPLPDEIAACQENVKRQIALIKPKVICTLGKFASQTLLKTERPISSLRGRLYEYDGIPVIPTFHPAYLLRNPQDKRLVWEDMKKIKKLL